MTFTFIGLSVKTSDSTGKNPGVESLKRIFFTRFEIYFMHNVVFPQPSPKGEGFRSFYYWLLITYFITYHFFRGRDSSCQRRNLPISRLFQFLQQIVDIEACPCIGSSVLFLSVT